MSGRTLVILGLFLFMLAGTGWSGSDPAQKWEEILGRTAYEDANSAEQTTDGGYIIAGVTNSITSSDAYLIKTDSSGKKTWDKTFGGSGLDSAKSVQQTTDGGYIIAGETNSMGGLMDVYLIKINAAGDKEWDKTFGRPGAYDDSASSVQQTSDGGYIIAGSTDSMGKGLHDVYLIKTNDAGDKIWEKTFGGPRNDYARSVRQTSDGGYIVAGNTFSMGEGSSDVYLIKTDSSGKEIWEKTFGGRNFDSAHSVQQTRDGGYIVAGNTGSSGAGSDDIYLIKIDSSGKEIWEKTFGGRNIDFAKSVLETSDGGYIVAGGTYSIGAGSSDVYLIKTDSSGNKIWEKTFGGPRNDWANSVRQTGDGGYIIAGKTDSKDSGTHIYLIKTDSEGNSE